MQPDDRDNALLLDMLKAAAEARDCVRRFSEARYLGDRLRQLALERALEVVGEAASRVSAGFRAAHPEIEWRRIVGQRNLIAHRYGEIDHSMLYQVAREKLPGLTTLLRRLLGRV